MIFLLLVGYVLLVSLVLYAVFSVLLVFVLCLLSNVAERVSRFFIAPSFFCSVYTSLYEASVENRIWIVTCSMTFTL